MPALAQSRWKTLIECLRQELASLGEQVRTDWQDGSDTTDGIVICFGRRRGKEHFRPPRIIVYPASSDLASVKQAQSHVIGGRQVTSILDREIQVIVEIRTPRPEDNIPTLFQDRLIDNVLIALNNAGFIPNNVPDNVVGELYPTEDPGNDAINLKDDVVLLTFIWDQPVFFDGPATGITEPNIPGLNMPVTKLTEPGQQGKDYVDEIG